MILRFNSRSFSVYHPFSLLSYRSTRLESSAVSVAVRSEVGLPKLTAQQLKEHNQRLVLKAVYSGQAASRAAIALETGLTRPTVSQMVGELLEIGLVREQGPGESSGGKPPTLLGFNDEAHQILALHLGGRQTLGVVTDLRGRILKRVSRPTDQTSDESVLEGLFVVLDELHARATRPLLGVGVSTPGLVDLRTGVVRYSTHLKWHELPLSDRLSARYRDDVPIIVDNDANLAALGERVFGVGGGVDNMVMVMVGTFGIGAGIIVNGEIFRGAVGGAGEIGHMPVADSGAPCMCGRRGCLEAVASVWALMRRAAKIGISHPDSELRALDPDGTDIEDLHRAVAAGDPGAEAIAQEAGHYIGLAVASLISVLNPQRVVVGGSVLDLGRPFFERLESTVMEQTLSLLTDETEILPASLGADVNMLGAVAQVLNVELGVI